MGVGWVQNWTGVTAASGDLAITGTALTAGNYIVFGVRNVGTADVISINSIAETAVLTQDQGTVQLSIFIFKAVGGETSFTFTGNSGDIDITASEFSSIDPTQATAVDQSASVGTASATTATTGTTAASSIADAMAVTFAAWGGAVTVPTCADASASGGANYTLGAPAVTATIRMQMAWKALSVAEAEVGTWSWTTARGSATAIIVLKGIAAGGSGGGTAMWTGQDNAPRKRRAWW